MHRESMTQLSQRHGTELKKDRHIHHGRRIQSIRGTYARDAPKAKEADTGGQPTCNLMIGKRSEQLKGRGGCRREVFLEMYTT